MSKANLTNKQYQKLIQQIQQHNYNYHTLDAPKISDREFDKLFQQVIDYEEKNPDKIDPASPSQRVGGPPISHFEKLEHQSPMLSLQNSYDESDLVAFDERIRNFLKTGEDEQIEYFCEPKLDGLALELVYDGGRLIQAITRGDGSVGENVFENARTIKNIPLKINYSGRVDIRGEVVIHKDDFVKLNAQNEDSGIAPFANPRNAAAGTLRQLNPSITAARPLRFYAYALGYSENADWDSQSKFVDWLREQMFPTVDKKYNALALGAEELQNYYRMVGGIKSELNFDIDGVVFKVNSFELQFDLGNVARSPRWASAAKYEPEQGESIIDGITVQVGRTGALTPVAELRPVEVGGVTISSATLHNQDEIDRKDIRIGDAVIIQRAGDVIPEVVEVIKEKRKKGARKFTIPEDCPECGQKSFKPEEEVVRRCLNPLCPAVQREGLKHFVSRKAMNIDKVGEKLVDTFYNEKLVLMPSDFYRLKKDQLLELERMGDKSTENILNSIEASKKISFDRFIFSLGIRFVGEQTAKILAKQYENVDRFLKVTPEELVELRDIGPKVANSIVLALANKEFVKEIKQLIKVGVTPQFESKKESEKFAGLSFVITGTLPVKRDQAKAFIEANGGRVLSAVSKKLDYLLAGEEAGSKLVKANDLGIAVIDWNQLNKLLD